MGRRSGERKIQMRIGESKITFFWNQETRTWRMWAPSPGHATEGTAPDLDAARDAVRATLADQGDQQ